MTIRNEQQLDVTRRQIAHMEAALRDIRQRTVPDDTDPVLWKAYADGIESNIETMQKEIAEYKLVRSGGLEPPPDAGF